MRHRPTTQLSDGTREHDRASTARVARGARRPHDVRGARRSPPRGGRDPVALRTPDDRPTLTYAEMGERSQRSPRACTASASGRGDTVGLMMVNRPGFHIVDPAAMHARRDAVQRLQHLAARAGRVRDGDAGNRVVDHRARSSPSRPRRGRAGARRRRRRRGARRPRSPTDDLDLEAAWRAVEPDDILTLIYTSGTTGPPKGVEITHANMLAELRGCTTQFRGREGRPRGLVPAQRPHRRPLGLAVHARSCTYGNTVTCCPGPARRHGRRARRSSPTVFGAVPRVWEKVKAGAGGRRRPDGDGGDPRRCSASSSPSGS